MYLIKNQENTVILNLQAEASTANPEFIIKFTSEVTKEEKVIAVTDESNYTERHNKFTITETEDEDFVHSAIDLSPSGQWAYVAYEMAASSPRNLDTADALKQVGSGIAIVHDSTEGQVNNFDEDDTQTNPVFDEE